MRDLSLGLLCLLLVACVAEVGTDVELGPDAGTEVTATGVALAGTPCRQVNGDETCWWADTVPNRVNLCPEAPLRARLFRKHPARAGAGAAFAPLYVIGGSCSWYASSPYSNMGELYNRYAGPAYYVDGPDLDGTLSEPILAHVIDLIVSECRDRGECRVNLAGYSRGAFIATAAFYLANNRLATIGKRLSAGTTLLLDPVDRLIGGFTNDAPGDVLLFQKTRSEYLFPNATIHCPSGGCRGLTRVVFDLSHASYGWDGRPLRGMMWFANRYWARAGTSARPFLERRTDLLDNAALAGHSNQIARSVGAVASSSGGGVGAEAAYRLNDGDSGCGGLHWLSPYPAGTSPNVTLTLPRPAWVGRVAVSTVSSGTPCGSAYGDGKTLAAAAIEYWTGSSWARLGAVSGRSGDWTFEFPYEVWTSRVRLVDLVARVPGRSMIVRELFVGGGCLYGRC